MKFSFSSLAQYLATSAGIEEICLALTRIGLEVESVQDCGRELLQFSVAKIASAKPHPESTKLQICLVETIDSKEPLQIICGASNARSGIKVAYAKIGSVIPVNGMVIKKAKIAGIESCGMLCSAYELGLDAIDENSGIIEIPEQFAIGTKISEVFDKNDAIIEVNITANRGDCLGVYGIARDLAASGIGQLKQFSSPKIPANFLFDLEIANFVPQSCPYACFRIIKNVRNCQSPKWLVERLNLVGINSISAIVDITNLVMHELNRPMHAYDRAKIIGKLAIRNSTLGEKFISLKDHELLCNDSTVLISDEQKPLAIAGIIGSSTASCSLESTEILLESAFFNPESISKAGRYYAISSESRHRFERGVDWQTCLVGMELASKLIIEICGGVASDIKIIGEAPEPRIVDFELKSIKRLIGVEVNHVEVEQILERLGFVRNSEMQNLANANENESWQLLVPSHRHDIFASEDLVEEVVRIWGYEKITKNNSFGQSSIASLSSSSSNIISKFFKFRNLLADRGMSETINWSFVDSRLVELFGKVDESLILQNPISSEMNHLRINLALGLISVYQKNSLRGFFDLSLFEIGNVFEDKNTQKIMIAGLRAGKNKPCDHYHDQRDFDVFDVKQDFLAISQLCGISQKSLQISSENPPPYYHPHRFASVKLGKNLLGYFGEIHPQIAKKFDLKNRPNFFEIFADKLPEPAKLMNRKPFIANDFQTVERDFAFLVDENLAIGKLLQAVENVERQLIYEIELFDIFYGKSIPIGKKSVAFRVKMQPQTETMTSQQIDEISRRIIIEMEKNFSASLRS